MSIQNSQLYFEVKHNLRTEIMIWAWGWQSISKLRKKSRKRGSQGIDFGLRLSAACAAE